MQEPYRIGRVNGRWFIIFWDTTGKRHRHALGTSDAREAQRLAPAYYAELTRPRGTTVADLWQAYTLDMAGRAITVTMVHTWKALRDRFGPMAGHAVTIADCRAHIADRRNKGIRDGTLLTELGHLRNVLRWAEKHRLIDKAPHIERPAQPKPVERHFTREQVHALLRACTMPHLRLFVHLAYASAGRASALLGLTWDRCDFEREKIDLRDPAMTAPHKGRAIIPMTGTLRAALLEARTGALSPYVIEWAGGRVKSVKKGIKAAGRLIGLAHISPHMLRHSAAVHMAEAGVPMDEIASYLGHNDTKVTRLVYAKFSPEHLRYAARTLELGDLGQVRPKENYSRTAEVPDFMVGATGIEPVTPTMSREREAIQTVALRLLGGTDGYL